jgi:hypothetical protein
MGLCEYVNFGRHPLEHKEEEIIDSGKQPHDTLRCQRCLELNQLCLLDIMQYNLLTLPDYANNNIDYANNKHYSHSNNVVLLTSHFISTFPRFKLKYIPIIKNRHNL